MDNHERRVRYVTQRYGCDRATAGRVLAGAYERGTDDDGKDHVAALLSGRQRKRLRSKRGGEGAHRAAQRERRELSAARIAALWEAPLIPSLPALRPAAVKKPPREYGVLNRGREQARRMLQMARRAAAGR